MFKNVHLFISAGPDLESEREALGKAVAQTPISLGWTIQRTAGRGEPLDESLQAIRQSDFFILLMGEDITAPVGFEVDVARRSQRLLLPFLKEAPRTPAAFIFLREVRLDWVPFREAQEIARLAQIALARHFLDRPIEFGLTPEDWQRLESLLKSSQEEGAAEAEETASTDGRQELGGAGGGGIILPAPPGTRPEEPLPDPRSWGEFRCLLTTGRSSFTIPVERRWWIVLTRWRRWEQVGEGVRFMRVMKRYDEPAFC